MKRLHLLACLLLFLPLRAAAADADGAAGVEKKLTWYRMDFPPVYISEGPYQANEMQGPVDEAIKRELERHGYAVVFSTANYQRIVHDLQTAQPACTGILLRTPELESSVEFSIAHSLALPGGVILKTKQLERFRPYINPAGRLELEALLGDERLRLGISTGREYTGIIDQVLARHRAAPQIQTRGGLDIGGGLVRMLLRDRIDYTIMFPWEANYLATVLGQQDEITSLPVEGMVNYVLAAGACPKTPWGKQVIALVNSAVRGVRQTPDYRRSKEYWLDPAARELYRKYAEQYFSRPEN